MATISNTPRPGYVWDATDNCWYPIGTGPHSHADYITSASAINPNIVDAKGDIIAATAADTVSRLAVGANDTVLTADSSTATGLKWGTVSSFRPFHIPKNTGGYVIYRTTTSAADRNPVEDTTYYMPIFLPGYQFDRISARTGAGFVGTATVRLGIYNADMTTGLPTTVYLDAGTATTSTGNATIEITINSTPPANWYFIAMNVQSLSSTNEWSGYSGGFSFASPFYGTGIGGAAGASLGAYSQSGVTGAFGTATSLTYSTDAMAVGLRMA